MEINDNFVFSVTCSDLLGKEKDSPERRKTAAKEQVPSPEHGVEAAGKAKEKIDLKKLIIYSEIMSPKYKE